MQGLSRAAVTTLAIATCACAAATGGSPPATPTATAVASHHLTGTIALGGDYTTTAHFSVAASVPAGATLTPEPARTCAGYAAGSGAAAFLGPVVETATNPAIFLASEVKFGYRGAGTYTATSTPGLSGTAEITVPTPQGGTTQVYRSTDASVMQLTVAADGSGTLTFQRWRTDEVRGNVIAGHLDGTITWVCM